MRMSPVGRTIMACAFVLLPCLLWVGPAAAHSALVGSTPKAGAVLTTAPRTIELEFSGAISNIAPTIVLRDDNSTAISRMTPTIARNIVSTPFPPGLADGSYSLVWRVVAADGHPLQGSIPFAIGHISNTSTDDDSAEPAARALSNTHWQLLGITIAAVTTLIILLLLVRRRSSHHTPETDRNHS